MGNPFSFLREGKTGIHALHACACMRVYVQYMCVIAISTHVWL